MRLSIALLCLLFAGSAGASAWTGESHGTFCIGSSCNNAAPVAPNTTAGRVILVYSAVVHNSAAFSLSTPAGWTRIDPTTLDSDTVYNSRVFCKVAVGGDTMPTLDWSSGGSTVISQAVSFSGPTNPDCATIVQVSSAGHSNAGNFPSQSLSIAVDNTLVFEFGAKLQDGTPVDYSSISCPSDVNTGQFANSTTVDAFFPQAAGCYRIETTATNVSSTNAFTPLDEESGDYFSVALALKRQDITVPSFSAGPTYTKVNNNTMRATFTASGSGFTAYGCLMVAGATAPTAAQIIAGTNCHGTCSVATTGSSQTSDCDASDNPALPMYDPYWVLDNAGTRSSVPTTTTTCLDPPASFTYTNCPTGLTSVSAAGSIPKARNDQAFKVLSYSGLGGGFFHVGEIVVDSAGAWGVILLDSGSAITVDVRSGAFAAGLTITDQEGAHAVVSGSPTTYTAIATGDILVVPTTVSPSGAAITVDSTGQLSFLASGQQSAANIAIYHALSHAYLSIDIDGWVNDVAPVCQTSRELVITVGSAMTTQDLHDYCPDPEADTTTFGRIQGSDPDGITFTDSSIGTLAGNATTENLSGILMKFITLDAAYAATEQDITVFPATGWPVPNCVGQPLATCESAVTSATHKSSGVLVSSSQCSNSVQIASVISQSPTSGATVAPGSNVSVVTSTGACDMPSCLGGNVLLCETRIAEVDATATLNQGNGCIAGTSTIYSQSPAVGTAVSAGFSLKVECR